MKKTVMGVALFGMLSVGSAQAEFKFDENNLYAGGGLGYTMWDVSDLKNSIGFNFFGGYDLDIKLGDAVGTAVEVGYATTGDTEIEGCTTNIFFSCDVEGADGLWVNGVFDYDLNDQVNVLGRIGLDLGDDDGLMFGVGAGYKVSDAITVRGEYVIRDHTKALQANVVYNF